MQIGTANGPRNRVYAGSNPVLGTIKGGIWLHGCNT